MNEELTKQIFAELFSALTLQSGYNSALVIVGTTLLGMAAGLIGSFALLRKRSLMGDALAHSTLPGLTVAYIIAVSLGYSPRNLVMLLSAATVSGILGILCVQFISSKTRLSEDAAIGSVLSVFFAFGVVGLSIIQSMNTGSEGGLAHFIYGQSAALNISDLYLSAALALFATSMAILFNKEFRLLSFDAAFASSIGFNVTAIDLIMMALVVVVTVVGLQAVGLLLIVALLIVPAAAARFWTERLVLMTYLSAIFGALSCYFGSVASTLLTNLPAGAIIVLCAGVIFIFSFLFAPCRGLLGSSLRTLALHLQVNTEHLLRDFYERLEINASSERDFNSALSLRDLPITRALNPILLSFLVLKLRLKGLLERDKKINSSRALYRLSTQGLKESQRLTRNHRLWEEYLLTHMQTDSRHVDRSADLVEHVLNQKFGYDLVGALEASLQAKGRLPNTDGTNSYTIKSLHPIAD